MPLATMLNAFLHEHSPYDGVDTDAYPFDLQGWCNHFEYFDKVVDALRPELIVEVGSWKGLSAHHLIKRAMRHRDATIICVDTWLGSSEHWLNPSWRSMLNLRKGRPTLFEQFMANVVHAGLQDRVVPLPLPSRLASVVVESLRINNQRLAPSLIYLDGAHDEASVREDIAAWWPLLSSGGVMLGDDYCAEWSGVITAVEEFRAARAQEIQMSGNEDDLWFAVKR